MYYGHIICDVVFSQSTILNLLAYIIKYNLFTHKSPNQIYTFRMVMYVHNI